LQTFDVCPPEIFSRMSIQEAVASIIAATNQLSLAAMPVMEAWMREQSGGAVSQVCPDELSAWLSSLHPERVEPEHDWALRQVNYLAWLLPGVTPGS
jgi:hypothetical protein